MLRRLYQKYKHIFWYGVWGVASTILNWITYAVLEKLTESVNLANIISWFVTIVFAFLTNKQMVFGSADWSLKKILPEAVKFLAARAATGVMELIGVPLIIHLGVAGTVCGVTGLGVKAAVTIVVIIVNYILSKIFVFAKKS